MTPYALTADIGTGSLKCACVDFDGRLLSFAREEYKAKALYGEDWENALVCAVQELSRIQGKLKPEAICISGNGPTLVPVDFHGESLRPLYWNDEKSLGSIEGCASFFLPRAAWFRENARPDYERTEYFFSSHEWLAWRLGADPFTSLPSPAYEAYYWNEEQCGVFGLDRGKFPPFVKRGSIAGNLSAKAAKRLCLDPGIPLVSGAPDFISAIIGSGALKPGDICDRAGSSEGINLCVTAQFTAEGFRTLPHAVDGFWNLSAVLPESGRLFECYREQCGLKARGYGELLAELIPERFNGNDWPLHPGGMNYLERGRLTLQSIGFSVRAALEKFAFLNFPVKEMTVSGGQAKNPLWNQLKADMTGAVLLIPEISDAELAGNAVLAALALGCVSSLEAGAAQMIRLKKRFCPREENAFFWTKRFLSAITAGQK